MCACMDMHTHAYMARITHIHTSSPPPHSLVLSLSLSLPLLIRHHRLVMCEVPSSQSVDDSCCVVVLTGAAILSQDWKTCVKVKKLLAIP